MAGPKVSFIQLGGPTVSDFESSEQPVGEAAAQDHEGMYMMYTHEAHVDVSVVVVYMQLLL